MTQKNDLNSQARRCHCTALRKASRCISQLYDAVLAPSGLKTTQRAILAQIQRSEPTTVGNLAEALVVDAGALAHTLEPLERDRLVSIDVDPEDRRNRVTKLTPAGPGSPCPIRQALGERTTRLWPFKIRKFARSNAIPGVRRLRQRFRKNHRQRFYVMNALTILPMQANQGNLSSKPTSSTRLSRSWKPCTKASS